jgi:hypothetical protein
VPAINIAEARQRLHRILASGTADVKLTLAARKEDELSDSDVLGMLEDSRQCLRVRAVEQHARQLSGRV